MDPSDWQNLPTFVLIFVVNSSENIQWSHGSVMDMSQLKEHRGPLSLEIWASFGCSGSMKWYDKGSVNPLLINHPISLAFCSVDLRVLLKWSIRSFWKPLEATSFSGCLLNFAGTKNKSPGNLDRGHSTRDFAFQMIVEKRGTNETHDTWSIHPYTMDKGCKKRNEENPSTAHCTQIMTHLSVMS